MKIQILNQKPLDYTLKEINGQIYVCPAYTSDYVAIQRIIFKKDNLPNEVKIVND